MDNKKIWIMKISLMLLIVYVIIASMVLVGCMDKNSTVPNSTEEIIDENESNDNQGETTMNITKNPIATITMENGDTIQIELYPNMAPQSVYNFISLANSGYYNGLIFHRIVQGFVLQGGDPQGTGIGGPGYSIEGEFATNGHSENDLTHTEGVISMARSTGYNSGGSQFFLVVGNATFLDGDYAGFGKTVDKESTDICMEMSKAPTDKQDRPLEPPTIKTITVETFGVDYPEPNKLSN